MYNIWLVSRLYRRRTIKQETSTHICLSRWSICTNVSTPMLQDEDDDQLTNALALNTCYDLYLIARDDDFDFKSHIVQE